jgi:hypothetical protein
VLLLVEGGAVCPVELRLDGTVEFFGKRRGLLAVFFLHKLFSDKLPGRGFRGLGSYQIVAATMKTVASAGVHRDSWSFLFDIEGNPGSGGRKENRGLEHRPL